MTGRGPGSTRTATEQLAGCQQGRAAVRKGGGRRRLANQWAQACWLAGGGAVRMLELSDRMAWLSHPLARPLVVGGGGWLANLQASGSVHV